MTPASSLSVLIPFRPGDPWRDRLWSWCESWWREHLTDAEIVVGDDGGKPFSRAASINEAALRAKGEVLILADGDTVWEGAEEAAQAVLDGAHYVPKGKKILLAQSETDRALKQGTLRGGREPTFRHPLVSPVAVSRAAFNEVRGFDPRFRGWGGEDNAFHAAVTGLVGPTSPGVGTAWHLWHPVRRGQDRRPAWPGQRAGAGMALARTYEKANRAELRELVNGRGGPRYSVAVMAHPSRKAMVGELQRSLGSRVPVSWDTGCGVWANRRASLKMGNGAPYHVVLQDDAKIGPEFHEQVKAALLRGYPAVSFFYHDADRSNPESRAMQEAARSARSSGESGFTAKGLRFGLALAIATEHIAPAIEHAERHHTLHDLNHSEDYCLGSYFESKRLPVWYELPSPVDHRDTYSILWPGGRDNGQRRAWWH